MLPTSRTHTHTQFSHGLKLERARWKIAEEAQFCCHTRPMGAKKGFYFIITSPARLLIAFLILSYPPLSPIKVKGVKIQNSTVVAPYQSGHAICNGWKRKYLDIWIWMWGTTSKCYSTLVCFHSTSVDCNISSIKRIRWVIIDPPCAPCSTANLSVSRRHFNKDALMRGIWQACKLSRLQGLSQKSKESFGQEWKCRFISPVTTGATAVAAFSLSVRTITQDCNSASLF